MGIKKEPLKIYFACPILGATQEDRDRYISIIDLLKKHGIVLTEFFADTKEIERKEKEMTDSSIFNRDIELIKESTVVVAEITEKSHGVGVELGFSSGRKPILCIRRHKEDRISPMILGNQHITLVHQYRELEELEGIFDRFFNIQMFLHLRA